MKYLLPIFIAFAFLNYSGNCQCQYKNDAFISGERLSYQVYYNWGALWFGAGMASFLTTDTIYNNKPALKIHSYGTTYPNYNWLYKVRDNFETVIHPVNVSPYAYERHTSEGDYRVDNRYLFDYNKHVIIAETQNSKKAFAIDTLPNNNCTLDVLSAVYACRTIDFSGQKINDIIPLHILIDTTIYKLYIRYLGKESITNKDHRIFSCNKFSVYMVEGTIFKGGEDVTVWVTDDKNQIPVSIEAKILIGSIKAHLWETDGYRWPANYNLYK